MQRTSRTFTTLALITSLLTIGLIVFGAVVRVSDSGLGCGDHWPLCDGRIIPPLDNLTAWIEWGHRLFAVLIGVLGLLMLVVAWRTQRGKRFVFPIVVIAAILYLLQSMLGAIVVKLELPPTPVSLHLVTAMLLLAALLASFVAAVYHPRQKRQVDNASLLIYITTALSLVIILTGALVRGSGATLACVDWPLCNGDLLPVNQGQAALIHMMHRFAVVGLGISLLLTVWQVIQSERGGRTRTVALSAMALYLLQAGVGAMFVLSVAAPVWGAAHVGLAAGTWALLVVLCVMEYFDTAEIDETEPQWKPQSNTAPN